MIAEKAESMRDYLKRRIAELREQEEDADFFNLPGIAARARSTRYEHEESLQILEEEVRV